ncbi:MAG: PEP-CTERM sorting domain-containing protein [Akkermansiaceae bacterium]
MKKDILLRLNTTVFAITICAFAPSVAGAATLAGQLGVLDLAANSGINPATGSAWQVGDTYRLVFASSARRNATSTDINVYNGFVQGLADSSTLFTGTASWKAIASTQSVNARINTGTTGSAGEAIFLTDGSTIIGTNYGDFWNGHAVGAQDIDLDENGNGFGSNQNVFTGISSNGSTITDRYLGTTTISNNSLRVTTGQTNPNSTGRWAQQFNANPTSQQRLYGLSDALTIVELPDAIPEPSSIALLGLGGFTLLLRRKK